jgi:hypothetical protein
VGRSARHHQPVVDIDGVDVEARGVLVRRLDQVFGRDDIADRGK